MDVPHATDTDMTQVRQGEVQAVGPEASSVSMGLGSGLIEVGDTILYVLSSVTRTVSDTEHHSVRPSLPPSLRLPGTCPGSTGPPDTNAFTPTRVSTGRE